MRIGRLMFVHLLAAAAACLAGRAALAGDAEALPPVSERFAKSEISEEPSFQRHVSPLFGRLGCNGRSCHGSFQGRGGFRLSLFGYDFHADHQELLKGDPLRANKEKPLESLILIKPTDADMHEGGLRYKQGGWEYYVFRRWLEAGAKFNEKDVQRIVNLEVTPAEIVFDRPGEKVNLKAVAVWPDGTREDVTCLCRFTSNSDQVATITADGLVTATDPGDTHLVVSYDSAVITVPVIRPVSQLTGDRYPSVPTPTKIDELVVQKLRKLGEVPSDLCTDAEFLRRVSLDLTGTLPTAIEAEQFIADPSPTKRADKIEQLIKTPAYAAWWTTRLCDWTGNNDTKFNNFGVLRNGASQQWYDWIYKRVAENMPYDKLIDGMVTGVSRKPGESYAEYCAVMSDLAQNETAKSYADRPDMPYFWARQNLPQPQDKAIAFAYAFLGIRIQCAQCHKHPFDQWSKDDFDDFRNFFGTVRSVVNGAPQGDRAAQEDYQKIVKDLGLENSELRGNQLRNKFNELLRQGKTVPFPEVAAFRAGAGNRRPMGKKTGEGPTGPIARVLGGEEIDLTKVEDARQPLMDWLRQPHNPYFAKAFVNRVWANYFSVGIVQPPDDMSLANPPSNKALLDYLAQGFVEYGFDMQWVHREICNSRTYQLSWQANETNAKDERNFARAVPRRLPAEVAVDAVNAAVASDEKAATYATDLKGRAIAVAGAGAPRANNQNANGNNFALQVFGRSIRESNCDCDRSMEASLLQTVYLQNDGAVLQALEQERGSWIGQITRQPPSKLSDGSDVSKLDLKRELAQMDVRLKRAKAEGRERQIEMIEKRIAELEKAAGMKKEAAETTGRLALDEPTVVRQAYLRTLSRLPTPDEMSRCLAYMTQADSPASGAKGLLWTLLNTKEFIVNH
jgi:Protein of unknown function (DUF1549)/Protein of unknown function (DUF1553)